MVSTILKEFLLLWVFDINIYYTDISYDDVSWKWKIHCNVKNERLINVINANSLYKVIITNTVLANILSNDELFIMLII